MKLLHIDSSIMSDKSVSRQLTAAIVERLKQDNGSLDVTYYDLDREPFAYLSSASFSDETEQGMGAQTVEEFLAADVVVIGAPMYNFSIPAQLKSWIDRVAVAGKTFHYTENGPEGLAGGKRVIVASTRGGYYGEDSGLAALDHQESYLKTVFGFFGITDVEFIRAEGVAVSPENAEQAIAAAKQDIVNLAA
ncbi:FMN-dependent NADH-azoreductase [Emcibacter nanhaiensis]|uniref:FMN dependent NADH:quinone oxidoreductase n=1 Tax=Emcibacter nanhaiensis TaxID=1505037 RepID=A0A501PLS0_9PROT|nr:FMN-dependent NADH-azoreductase [Emcibacter nanhaiensis]TPD61460.1 FMN-dependent NADH-azoreductase [Emcibacter nanhaiensis]